MYTGLNSSLPIICKLLQTVPHSAFSLHRLLNKIVNHISATADFLQQCICKIIINYRHFISRNKAIYSDTLFSLILYPANATVAVRKKFHYIVILVKLCPRPTTNKFYVSPFFNKVLFIWFKKLSSWLHHISPCLTVYLPGRGAVFAGGQRRYILHKLFLNWSK